MPVLRRGVCAAGAAGPVGPLLLLPGGPTNSTSPAEGVYPLRPMQFRPHHFRRPARNPGAVARPIPSPSSTEAAS